MNLEIKYLSYYQSLYSLNRGKAMPVKRKELHSFVKLFDPSMKDRDMRRYYEMLDKCWCRGGLFYPTIKEVKQEIGKITGTIIHFGEKKRLLEKLEDKLKKEPIQMRLF